MLAVRKSTSITTTVTEDRDTLTLASPAKSTTLMTDMTALAEVREPLKRLASLILNTRSKEKLTLNKLNRTILRKSKKFNQLKKNSWMLTLLTPETNREETIETEVRAEEIIRIETTEEEVKTRTEKEDLDVMRKVKLL